MFYWFAYFWVWLTAAIYSPRKIIGKENIPSNGPFIVAGNHLSNIDPLLIGLSLQRRISYMAKDSLFRNPLLGCLLHWVEAFPVKRGVADVWALREAIRRLKCGLPVVMFPEGTRNASTKENKSGIGFLAVKGRVPIVPVHITGSEKVLPRGAKHLRRNRVVLSFGKPMTFTDQQSYEEIVASVMTEIHKLSGSPSDI